MRLLSLQNLDDFTSHAPCNICVKRKAFNHNRDIICLNECKFKHSSDADKIKVKPK